MSSNDTNPRRPRQVRVWDLPTRIFHGLLVVLVAVNLYTGNIGGLVEMELHMLSGSAILALVMFRLAWGVVGSRHSRFAAFLRGPRAVLAYGHRLVAGTKATVVGHNPMGGWSVVAMLTSLLIQAVSGLFANDDIITEGPLAKHVSKAASDSLTVVHGINAGILCVLIAFHLAAVFGYLLVKKVNLIRPMVTGRMALDPTDDADDVPFVSPWRGVAIGIAAAALAWAAVSA